MYCHLFIFSGHHVHHRHPDQLPHHVRERERRGRVAPLQDRRPLLPRLVHHRPRRRHPVRPPTRWVGHGRGEFGAKEEGNYARGGKTKLGSPLPSFLSENSPARLTEQRRVGGSFTPYSTYSNSPPVSRNFSHTYILYAVPPRFFLLPRFRPVSHITRLFKRETF